MKWLLTAFEPFAQAKSNSSLVVAQKLSALDWKSRVEFRLPLPVIFADAHQAVGDVSGYDGVLALGQAEGRTKISLERVALNFADTRVPDNAGFCPSEEKLTEAGCDLHWSPIPWPRFARPANCELSYSAGTFVCNALFYRLLEAGTYAGFVHIPLIDTQMEFASRLPRMREVDAVASMKSVIEFLISL